MNIRADKIITKLFILGIVISTGLLFFNILVNKPQEGMDKSDFTTGLTKGQQEYFQEQMRETGKQYKYIRKGKLYLKNGDVEEAIKTFTIALEKAYSKATRGEAISYLADAYEKNKNYKKALEYVILDKDEYVSDWAKAPIKERAKYLEYAIKGEYELTIEYARKALEVETNMPYNKGVPSKAYIDRLADLIAAKDYILSLKKEGKTTSSEP